MSKDFRMVINGVISCTAIFSSSRSQTNLRVFIFYYKTFTSSKWYFGATFYSPLIGEKGLLVLFIVGYTSLKNVKSLPKGGRLWVENK
jgi:predicted Co/Zn/Cd cation transporter (cation efflux family)